MSDESRIESVVRRTGEAYVALLERGDVERARKQFVALVDEIEGLVSAPQDADEKLEALHLLGDLANELGDAERVKTVAGELSRIFEPESPDDLEALVEDLAQEWWCPEAASRLLDRLEGTIDTDVIAEQREFLDRTRKAMETAPINVEQTLALREYLLSQGLVMEVAEGFELVEDEEQPLRLTEAWLTQNGLDVAACMDFLQDWGSCESDLDVLLSLAPTGPYDALAHWELEGVVRRYWIAADEAELADLEECCEASPDDTMVAIFDDDEDAAYLYVYDQEDQELCAPPLWLYNRKPAPAGSELTPGPDDGAPLMAADFLKDTAPRGDEPGEFEILWSADSRRVAIVIDDVLTGLIDLDKAEGYTKGLAKECGFGKPWPEGLTWDE